VEKPRDVAEPCWSRQFPPNRARRTRAHSIQ
jgi:hypothetical protein